MKTFNFRRLRIQSAMTLLVTALLLTGNCSPVTAQVAIGGDGTVTPGALLDLSQATDAGGLLLPQIESADTATAVLRKPGMLVYNKTDGKIYAYNGTAWSAGGGSGGSGGGGGEPDPTPSPTSCSGSVMGLSGTVYPIGSYPYAQNDLKNLCWTLTNLQEAGASYTSYEGQDEVRGYYYGTDVASNPISDICKENIGIAWRVPNAADWGLVKGGYADLTYAEKNDFIGEQLALAGGVTVSTGHAAECYRGWGVFSMFRVGGGTGAIRVYSNPPTDYDARLQFYTFGWGMSGYFPSCLTGLWADHPYASVRCVRDL
ncbi:MAG: hypothetical protein LBN93_03380 [Candidatus Symbiothrix sp.]|jgi:hypothetical protein|nr:hypothetical protein [Candidatus Symbiothrix sp.]